MTERLTVAGVRAYRHALLYEFLESNRDEIIARTQAKVASRSAPRATLDELNGVPLFLNQLGEALRRSRQPDQAIGKSAAERGGVLLRMGFTVAQVVHDYGDVCQAITEQAAATGACITAHEFQTLNYCLDEAIAEAVTAYTEQRERSIARDEMERLGVLAHELRNKLYAAMMAFEILKKGDVGIGGSTGHLLGRSLSDLRDLVARSLAEVRLESPLSRRERVALSDFIEEVEVDAALQANARGRELSVAPVEKGVTIEVDRQILAAALTNLLQNAFKFSRAGGHVSLRTSATHDRVLMEVEDECGGLPSGRAEELFRPFEQRSANRTGVGFGLSIVQRSVEVNGGVVRVRDLPGRGCVFTIDLPRTPPSLV